MKLRTSLAKLLGINYPSQGQGFWQFLQPIPAETYQKVGDGTGSSVVMAPLNWLARTFPEAPLVVDRRVDDSWAIQNDHPMAQLVSKPNQFWSGEVLWWATVQSLVTSGNAYWIKVRDRGGAVAELWWAPTWCVEPKWRIGGNEFITFYEYNVGVGDPTQIPISEIVHFRWGVDPQNIRKGLSPLAAVLREIFSDMEANAFSAALLKNMGVPGLVISPDGDAIISDEDMEASQRELEERFTGDKRGKPLVAGAPTKVSQFGFSPQQMDMRALRRLPEERVTAVTGVPAIVAGLGAGLDRSTFANMAEAREMAYETGIIPLQRMCASDLKNQLLGDFEGPDLRDWRTRFALEEVRVLQEDETKIVERKLKELNGGAITLAEYRRETGREAKPEHDVYLRPMNLIEVRADELGQHSPTTETEPETEGETEPETEGEMEPEMEPSMNGGSGA